MSFVVLCLLDNILVVKSQSQFLSQVEQVHLLFTPSVLTEVCVDQDPSVYYGDPCATEGERERGRQVEGRSESG